MPEEQVRLLVALGGNAIKQAHEAGTAEEQFANCETSAEALAMIVSVFREGDSLAITHGNGPQSGNLDVQQVAGKKKVPAQPLDVVGAMTQGQIGYMFMNTMEKHLRARGVDIDVIAVVNQVVVDPNDPEFVGDNASKPVGNFLADEEAHALKEAHPDYVIKHVKPSAQKGWRRTVPSPIPVRNAELRAINKILDAGIIVIASGGGGIPVMEDANGNYQGLEAVIDKDRAGEVLAEGIGADTFMILTDVEHAMLNYGREDEQPIGHTSVADMKKHMAEGHFLAGSMGPKVASAVRFVERGGERAIITSLGAAVQALAGKTGTIITKHV
jgi:carbamate kinase